MADAANTTVERLQGYEGINEEKAIGRFDESLQRLCVELRSKSAGVDWEFLQAEFHSQQFFSAGPLLRALQFEKASVLLIDELDKVDHAFEPSLLELLSVWQLSIPKLGTIQARTRCKLRNSARPSERHRRGGYTECAASTTTPNNAVPNQAALILTDGASVGGGETLTKGRLNFSSTPEAVVSAHHFITLLDSQPALTKAMWGYRAPASPNDTWIGTDVAGSVYPNAGQLAFGAPISITHYIRQTGDGVHANWLERLTAEDKTFAVPVKINEGKSFTLGNGSPLSQMKIYRVNATATNHVPAHGCGDVFGEAKGLSKSDQITSVTPPGRLGNLSLNAYPTDEGQVVLHFCNPSNSEATVPSGSYSFLAVR